MSSTSPNLRRCVLAWTVVVVILVFISGIASRPQGTANAEVRKSPPRKAFLSGGARSELVLRDILKTLQSIDSRVSRIERAVLDIKKGGQQ